MPLVPFHQINIRSANNAIYNGGDDCLTFEIDEARQNLRTNDTLIYDFERAMQGPALEMMLRGFRVDFGERESAIIQTQGHKDSVDRILSGIIGGLQGHYNPKFPNSTKQLQTLFYDIMKLKPIERTINGETKRPMNRDALEKLQLQDRWAAPIISAILLHRDLSKSLQVLETEIESDTPLFKGDINWRWHCSYNIGGTTTGRWSSSKSPFGTGCVLPTNEALTPHGWRRVDKLKDGDAILQWNKDTNKFEWACCKMFSQDYIGELYKAKTEQISQTLTAQHRVVFLNSRMDTIDTQEAWKVSQLSQEVIPLGAFLDGDSEEQTLEVPRFVAMLMADFSKEHSTWRGTLKKQRKIDRFLSLAKEFELDWEEQPYHQEGYRRFVVRNQGHWPKEWGQWVLSLTRESAEDLIEESRFWDSTDRGSGFIFFTADSNQADWYSTLVHLTGRACTKRLVQQNEGSYSTTPIWWINVKNRAHARVQRKHWTKSVYKGPVYCPSVPSTYWLMREDGFISVTGNSNFQNITEELRRIFIPDPGMKLYGIDKAQSEARDVGWFCGTILNDWSYLDACESGDLHTYVTRLLYPEWAWTGDLRKDRAIAERRFYRLFTYRDASKRLGHATNYLGQPREISRQTRIPLHQVEEFQDRYFTAFPCVAALHKWVAQQLQRERFLVNSFGRRRDFFDRPDAYDTLKDAVAYLFQSATGDCLNLGLWRLWRRMRDRVQILSQLHDAVYFQAPIPANDNEEQDLIRDCLNCVQITQYDPQSGRSMTIPGEAVGGFNWAHRFRLTKEGKPEEWNPRGLDKLIA